MPTESEEVTRNGDLNNINVDDDGFQKVLTSSERRVLKKKQSDVKRVTLGDCNSLENSILSRLKKRGLDLLNDPDHTTVESSTVEPDELVTMVNELDEAILGVLFDAKKPDQNLTVSELDNRIRAAKSNLSQMKTRKKGTFSEEELVNATKETDVYIAYLQQQISLTREYQKLKNAQNSLVKLKTALKDLLAVKTRLKNNVPKTEKKVHTPSSDTRFLGTTKRSMEYVYDFIKEMKDKHGESFEMNDLTSQDYKLVDGTKFNHPYTYLQKVKQKFDVFIDKTGSKPVVLSVYGCTNDVKSCVEYLSNLDLSCHNKLPMSFSKYRLLLDLEDKYNVLLNYNSGTLDVIGTASDVKSFLDYVDMSSKDSSRRASKENDLSDKDSSKGSDVTDLTSNNDKMYDYYVLRALSGKFRSNVRELETEYGVGIKFDLTPRNGFAKVSFVPLLDNSIDKCVQKFTNYVEEYAYKDLGKLTSEELTFLGDNDVLKKRYRSQHTTLVKVGDKVYVVGLKKHLNFGYNRAQLLLESRRVAPYKFKVTNSQYHLLLPHLTTLQDQKGVYVATTPLPNPGKDKEPHNGDKHDKDKVEKDNRENRDKSKENKDKENKEKEKLDSVDKRENEREKGLKDKELQLYIYGNAHQQKECLVSLNEMLSSFANKDLSLSGVEYNFLLEEKNKLQELENKYKVKVTMTKNSLNLSGPKSQVELVNDELKTLLGKLVYFNLNDQSSAEKLKNQSLVYAVLFVPQKSLGKIIGKGGSTLKQILLQSSLNNIIITKSPYSSFTCGKTDSVNNFSPNNSVTVTGSVTGSGSGVNSGNVNVNVNVNNSNNAVGVGNTDDSTNSNTNSTNTGNTSGNSSTENTAPSSTNETPNNKDSRENTSKNERKSKSKDVDVLLMIGNGLGVYFTVGLVKQVLESDDEVTLGKADTRSLYDEYTSKHSIMRRTSTNYSSSSTSSSSSKYKAEEKLDINDLHNFPSL